MAVITFPQDIDATLQVGDSVYKLNGVTPELLGVCTAVSGNELTHDESGGNSSTTGDYILFQKNITANNNNPKGYYLEASLKLNSVYSKELFAVNSQINISSK